MNDIDGIHKNDTRQSPMVQSRLNDSRTVSLLSGTRKPRRWLRFTLGVLVLCVLVTGTAVLGKAANVSQKIFVGKKNSFFGKVKDLVTGSPRSALVRDKDGQINILLLGIGGEGHDGPYLSDTIMLAQIRPEAGEAALVSIPRDYWVSLPRGQGDQKINAAFALGFARNKNWNEGGEWARQAVENISGKTIPYFAVVDFSGFEKAVDQIGGLDVQVERTFTDYTYPDSNFGYLPPVTFKEGPDHMNGTRALQFARSRHSAGIEGSDFARSKRQEKILSAFRQKVLGLNLFSDASKLNSLLNIFADHFHTNISLAQINELYGFVKEKNGGNVTSVSLDPSTQLVCDRILESNGAYVITPCPGKSESDIRTFFQNAFALGKLSAENSTVWLANSTENQQAYKTAYRKLTNAGLTVIQLPYSKDNLPQTIVYAANPKPATVEFINNILNATINTVPPPDVKINPAKVDVVIILGQNAPAEPDPKPYIAPPARKPTTTTSTLETLTPTSTPSTKASTTPVSTSTSPKIIQH